MVAAARVLGSSWLEVWRSKLISLGCDFEAAVSGVLFVYVGLWLVGFEGE